MAWHDGIRKTLISAGTKLVEALSGFGGGSSGDGDPDLAGYRRITDKNVTRDLEPMSQQQMIRVCHWLYEQNPIAGWLIDQALDLLLGVEIGFSVEIDVRRLNRTKVPTEEEKAAGEDLAAEIKDDLTRFWEHPTHNLRMNGIRYATTLHVSGELCLPVAAINDVNGIPQLDCIDAAQIADVEMFPGSSLVVDAVQITRPNTIKKDRKLVIREDPQTGRYAGEVFFFRHGRLLNSRRGRSRLLRTADVVDMFDQFLMSCTERAAIRNNMVWDVQMENADATAIRQRVVDIAKNGSFLKPGGVHVHNQAETLKAVSNDLGAGDNATHGRMLLNVILGSLSYPEAWFASGGETNRSTASEQTDVAMRSLQSLQVQLKGVFDTILHFAYDSYAEKQGRPARGSGAVKIHVDLPPVGERDVARLSTALGQLVMALETAIGAELVSQRTARKSVLQLVDKLGTPVDPDDEVQQIDLEASDRQRKQQEDQAAAAKAAFGRLMQDNNPGDPAAIDPPPPNEPKAPKVPAQKGAAAA